MGGHYAPEYTVQGICMAGWHVPTDDEWTVLTTYLGGQAVAGGKLKETGTKLWLAPNSAATNESGFTAIPGGMGYLANFGFLTINSLFWSSSQNSSATAWDRILYSDDASMGRRGDEDKSFSKSVRCIRN